ncbi:MAG: hypothetical protein IKO20_07745 [Bacteroidaceae bacterium]|nr:hypothetical protein [Bacteroidaceae bacterium]
MSEKNSSLPPLPEVPAAEEKSVTTPPPLPAEASKVSEEHIMSRPLRYTIGVAMLIAAIVAAVMLYTFVHDVLMDDHEVVSTQDVQLDQYVINDPPVDTRRSHVRMKPGSHPEAGYIADESVLIREREEDARFREQNGTPVPQASTQPKPEQRSQPAKPAEEGTKVETSATPPPASQAAPPETPAQPVKPAESNSKE